MMCVREIEMDGLLWGAAGLEDVGFGESSCCNSLPPCVRMLPLISQNPRASTQCLLTRIRLHTPSGFEQQDKSTRLKGRHIAEHALCRYQEAAHHLCC